MLGKSDWQTVKDMIKVIVLMSIVIFLFTCSQHTLSPEPLNDISKVYQPK